MRVGEDKRMRWADGFFYFYFFFLFFFFLFPPFPSLTFFSHLSLGPTFRACDAAHQRFRAR